MGNIPSQDNRYSSTNNQEERKKTTLLSDSIQEHYISRSSNPNNTVTVHPLLNPSNLSQKTSTPTIAMAHNDQDNNSQSNFYGNNVPTSSQDVTMSGTGASKVNLASQPSTMNIDTEPLQQQSTNEEVPAPPPRRRSTLILTDDPEIEQLKMQGINSNNDNQTKSETVSSEERSESPEAKQTVPVEISWTQGGENVFITGSFTGWRKMIKLVKEHNNKFSIKLKLPFGTHRFRFIVDNELRFSDYLPTATDQMGNFVNYIEIQSPESSQNPLEGEQKSNQKKDSNLGLTNDDDDMGNGYTRFHEAKPSKANLDYVREIPAVFTDPSVMEQYYLTLDNNQSQNQSWLTPPQLPPHLESVILNNYSAADKSNSSGALPIPNHVVLNHLATTSIKHNTLAVASVVRYKRKYVTQVLYAPLQ